MTRGPMSASPLPHCFQSDGNKKLLTVDLPSLESLDGVDLEISGTEVRLQLPGSAESLCIPLPVDLCTGTGEPAARFSRKRRQLTIAWDLSLARADAEVADVQTEGPHLQKEEGQPEETHGSIELGWREKAALDCSPCANGRHEVEERPCLDLLQEEVEHALKQCTVEKLKAVAELRGVTILLGGFAVRGEATMTGQSCRFRVSVSLTWEALDAFGGQLGASGTASVSELTQELESPQVVVRASPGGAAQARAAGDWMKRRGAQLVSGYLNGQRLSEAVVSAGRLEVESGSCGQARSPGRSQNQPPKQEQRLLKDTCMTQWAEEWLKRKLASVPVRLFGGLAVALLEVAEVSGSASLSGSSTEPTALFHFRVACTWVARPSAAGAKEVCGSLCIPEFTSERSIQDCPVTVEASPGQKGAGQILAAFKQTGVAVVRSVLEEFVTELKAAVV